MECGCPDARWPERYILDAADLIEAMVNDDVAETPQDTAIITLSREDAEAFQDPDGNWIEGCLERLADACRAELEVER